MSVERVVSVDNPILGKSDVRMHDSSFSVEVSVDERTGSVRAAYIRVRAGEVAETREVAEGRAFADYGAEGVLIGVELIAPCELAILDGIAAADTEQVKRFLHGSPPNELVSA